MAKKKAVLPLSKSKTPSYDIRFGFLPTPPKGLEGAKLVKFMRDNLDRHIPKGWELDEEDYGGGSTPPQYSGFPGLLLGPHNRIRPATRQGVDGWLTRIPIVTE